MTEEKINPFGNLAKFHHIGLVVESIAKVNPRIKIWQDDIQFVKVAFIFLNGINIELIEPVGDKSPVARALKKNQKLVHLCYEVENIEQVIYLCKKEDFHCFRKPVPAVAFENRKIAWVLHKEYGLFELLETKRS